MRHLVSLENVGKSSGATKALSKVSFDLEEGEVHALVGENGAGKSTLMDILAGVLQPDSGKVIVDGTAVAFHSTHESKAAGIATVFQELSLVDGLSVGVNICAGQASVRFGFIDRRKMRERAGAALSRLGLALSAGGTVGTLLASQRQNVEIAKALDQLFHAGRQNGSNGAPLRVLILDEPISAFNAEEKTALFAAVRTLRAQGVGIIYISHHLHEVIALADRITVLHDGATVWTRPGGDVSADMLVRAMVGRDVESAGRARAIGKAAVVSFRNVGRKGQVSDLSFDLHAGEILAVAGLDGSGRETVARLLAGIERPDQGSISLLGSAHPGSLRAAIGQGVGYVPDDRKALGLFLDMPIAANALSADLGSISRHGLVQGRSLRA